MIISTLRIVPERKNHRDVLEILASVQRRALVEQGFAGCQVCGEDEPKWGILYMEEWDTEEDLQRHICSKTYEQVLGAMELSIRPPELSIYYIKQTRSLELIEELREATSAK